MRWSGDWQKSSAEPSGFSQELLFQRTLVKQTQRTIRTLISRPRCWFCQSHHVFCNTLWDVFTRNVAEVCSQNNYISGSVRDKPILFGLKKDICGGYETSLWREVSAKWRSTSAKAKLSRSSPANVIGVLKCIPDPRKSSWAPRTHVSRLHVHRSIWGSTVSTTLPHRHACLIAGFLKKPTILQGSKGLLGI